MQDRIADAPPPAGPPLLEVVVCTFNRARDLDLCLGALGAQDLREGWQVTVVDNNCTDATPEIVAGHVRRGRIPGLRRLVERRQGLTPARQRGVAEAAAPWIALVDDDCRVAPDWIARAIAFAARHPEAGAFGGRVIPDWGRPAPDWLARHGWLFAAQDHGDRPRPVGSLVGTGLVLNRRALVEVGWLEEPLLPDRTGLGHVSGGDVEISLRLASGGRALWYAPDLRLDHRIAAARQRLDALLRLARGLGAGAELASLLGAADPARWPEEVAAILRAERRKHLESIPYVLRRRYAWQDWLIRSAFLAGQQAQHRRLRRDPALAARLGGRCRPPAGPGRTEDGAATRPAAAGH